MMMVNVIVIIDIIINIILLNHDLKLVTIEKRPIKAVKTFAA